MSFVMILDRIIFTFYICLFVLKMTLKFDVAGLNKYAFLTEKIVLLR